MRSASRILPTNDAAEDDGQGAGKRNRDTLEILTAEDGVQQNFHIPSTPIGRNSREFSVASPGPAVGRRASLPPSNAPRPNTPNSNHSCGPASAGRAQMSMLNIQTLNELSLEKPTTPQNGWLQQDYHQEISTRSGSLVENKYFQIIVSAAIVLSTFEIGLAMDFSSPEMRPIWKYSENVFTAIFFLELTLKLLCQRLQYFYDRWNNIDAFIVATAVLETWVLPMFYPDGAAEGLDKLIVLRSMRLVRLIRMVKFVRKFRQLVVLIEGVVDSLQAMVWITILLIFVLYIFAIFFVETVGLHTYPATNSDYETVDMDLLEDWNNEEYFGTVSRAMTTLLNMCLLTEWAEILRPVRAKQPYIFPFFILFVVFTTLGILNVIIGVIVENTTAATNAMNKHKTSIEMKEQRKKIEHLREIIFNIDVDGNNLLDVKEMEDGMSKDEGLRSVLGAIDLPDGFKPADVVTMLDDDGDGCLGNEEFVESLFRLVYCNKFQMMCLLKLSINQIKYQVKITNDNLLAEFGSLREQISEVTGAAAAQVHGPRDETLRSQSSFGSRQEAPMRQDNSDSMVREAKLTASDVMPSLYLQHPVEEKTNAQGASEKSSASSLLGSVSEMPRNDEGAQVSLGTSNRQASLDGTRTYYCGRRLRAPLLLAFPETDGRCGPNNGSQCASCQRYQACGNEASSGGLQHVAQPDCQISDASQVAQVQDIGPLPAPLVPPAQADRVDAQSAKMVELDPLKSSGRTGQASAATEEPGRKCSTVAVSTEGMQPPTHNDSCDSTRPSTVSDKHFAAIGLNVIGNANGCESKDCMANGSIAEDGSASGGTGKVAEYARTRQVSEVQYPFSRTLLPEVRCKGGHVLARMAPSEDGSWSCDGIGDPSDGSGSKCRSGIIAFNQSKGMSRFSCEACDYDLCGHCYLALTLQQRQSRDVPAGGGRPTNSGSKRFVTKTSWTAGAASSSEVKGCVLHRTLPQPAFTGWIAEGAHVT